MNFAVGFRHLSKMSLGSPSINPDERNISQTLVKDLFATNTYNSFYPKFNSITII